MISMQFKQIFFFDIDNTLCKGATAPVSDAVVKRLKHLEEQGYGIALCSGRPQYYVNGLARQLALKHWLLVTENGLVVQVGAKLPTATMWRTSADFSTIAKIKAFEAKLKQRLLCGDLPSSALWVEPNELSTCLFYSRLADGTLARDLAFSLIDEAKSELGDQVRIIEHVGCFDVLPIAANKGVGIKCLCEYLCHELSATVGIGDGPNDQEMFDVCAKSISLAPGKHNNVDYECESIEQALDYIEAHLVEQ